MATDFTEITDGNINGSGIFDLLMKSVNAHILQEYKAKRILATDYSQVYLGALQAAMSQSLQFSQQEMGRGTIEAQEALAVDQLLTQEQERLNLVDQRLTQAAQRLAIEATTAKSEAENAFIQQKTLTEEAQILDVVNGNPVAGITGAQKELYVQQKEGYIRDAEQKAAKIVADSYSVQRSTDDTLAPPSELNAASINEVIVKLKAGVDA